VVCLRADRVGPPLGDPNGVWEAPQPLMAEPLGCGAAASSGETDRVTSTVHHAVINTYGLEHGNCQFVGWVSPIRPRHRATDQPRKFPVEVQTSCSLGSIQAVGQALAIGSNEVPQGDPLADTWLGQMGNLRHRRRISRQGASDVVSRRPSREIRSAAR
jgi:hypothetical protein